MIRHRTGRWDPDAKQGSTGSLRIAAESLNKSVIGRLRTSRLWHVLLYAERLIHLILRPWRWISNMRGERIRLEVESVWPRVTGTLSRHGSSAPWGTLDLRHGNVTVSFDVDDVGTSEVRSVGIRQMLTFALPYPLSFGAFEPRNVRLSYGRHRSDIKRVLKRHPETANRLVEPLEILPTSVVTVENWCGSDPADSFDGDVAIVSIYTDAKRSFAGVSSLIAELHSLGYFVIVVDTSEKSLPVRDPNIGIYIHRRNEGWDFASWFCALLHFPEITTRARRLLLTNDSNYGPLVPFDGIVQRGRALGANVWGMTDSWAIGHHVQSYFLEFDTFALRSGALGEFMSTYPFPVLKDDVVIHGEIALTAHLKERGCSVQPLFPYESLAARFLLDFETTAEEVLKLPENQLQVRLDLADDVFELAFLLDVADSIRTSVPLDPTLHLWESLLGVGGPFIKRKLVLSREGGFPGVERLPRILSGNPVLNVMRSEAPERFIAPND